ncbi:hypothetical protein FQN50_007253 [Emmonsiellopsis sp. PD_5]|nr:hypothetical protein FQN50_007253 [Emmonsiellopsis sp. PD_5]
MADYKVHFPFLDSTTSPPIQVLEAAGVRYCVVGDLVIIALGGPLVLSDIYLAVADDQLELARHSLASHGFDELPQTHQRFFTTATKESPTGWPGYRFLPHEVGAHDGPDRYWATSTIIIPATMIDAVAERHGKEGLNNQISSYFKIQYAYLLSLLRDDVLTRLPVEDQFFIDLFDKVILYSVKKKVCYFRQQIRAGLITPEMARTLVPRKDLEIAAIKAKYRKPGQEAKGGKPSFRFPFDSSNVPQLQAPKG